MPRYIDDEWAVTFADLVFPEQQREAFREGALREQWAEQYPQLFDDDDLRIARNQPRYHFCEWLAAIRIYETTGYLSLVEKYRYKAHPAKRAKVRTIAPEHADFILDDLGRQSEHGQFPDLMVYAPDFADWWFCEVKGPNDGFRPNQREFFAEVYRRTGRPIRLVYLKLERQ